jgi:ribosomal-protein-alanine N-acetyltransferase
MKNVFLSGKRIYLRPLEKKDLKGNYVSWFNNEAVCEFNSHHVFPYTVAQAKNYIESKSGDKNNLALAIIVKKGNHHIGNISLQNINYINRAAEFAIILGENFFWGKGYAKEASLLIIAHGFKALNLHRIYCGTFAKNIAMQKLAKFLGMKKEGEKKDAIFKNGVYIDIVEFGLLDWNFKK